MCRQRISLLLTFATALWLLGALGARASEAVEFRIGYLRLDEKKLALSVLDVPPPDEGIAGAKVAINDNNTTGKFLNQRFILEEEKIAPQDDPLPAAKKLVDAGYSYLVVDLPAAMVLKIADAVRERNVLVFNAGATDDLLREEECRPNVFHTAPTRTMLADGLGQYLVWKQWRNWFLIRGSHEADKLWADALRRAAKRFGAKIVEERVFEDTGGARRTDTGQVQIQKQMPVFTQGAADHDVVVAADESEVFATYLPYRTWVPRPVAGSAGLMPSSWHPAHEQWGAAQIQNRFVKASGRRMLSKDMQAWTAVRIIGEAAQRTGSGDPRMIADYIKSPQFSIAAFKGQKVTFRAWNWQLRQPILLSDARSVVSVSPQEGFLHQFSELDTLGIDQPETKCVLR
ncbi:ABC transporter substrate-binding protein [Nordella sp. HKS 07]|uniref:ABC transporter substrate-binding protein n=1 Tax=Nordella sp. HKS 07 TaxID=2712222 RepID=UPI0013E1DC10|nr:ABC transporter substrate-binding protein [Nordella sp. HKS 07]QIG48404.1 ABC transporter substrate-binding protein [Nordella sp. HKS 07]